MKRGSYHHSPAIRNNMHMYRIQYYVYACMDALSIYIATAAQIHETHLLRNEQKRLWSKWTGRGKVGFTVGRAKGQLSSINLL